MKTQRRRFVQLAAGMMAAPILAHGKASAQGVNGKPPLRFFAIRESYGMPEKNRDKLWIDSINGDYDLTPNSIGTILQPLRNHLDKMVVMSGIDGTSHAAVRGRQGHGGPHCLTGSKATTFDAKGKMSHPSLDYAIGEYLNKDYGLAAPRVFPTLFLSDGGQDFDTNPGTFDMKGNPIRGLIGPKNVYKSLFGGGAQAGAPNPLLELDRASQAMTFDLVEQELRTLRPQLVQSNAAQVMDAYETSVNEIAAELEARASLGCETPGEPSNIPKDELDGRSMPLILDAVYHAFACDLASSLYYGLGGETRSFAKYPFLYDKNKHPGGLQKLLGRTNHTYSHGTDSDSLLAQQVARTYQMEEVAKLVDRLSETPDTDGSTLMDNTVIYLPSTYSHTTHKLDGRGGIPLVALAGANTNLRTGRHYDIEGSTLNDVLTTMGQGTGVPLTNFGGYKASQDRVKNLNNGPIEKMLKKVIS